MCWESWVADSSRQISICLGLQRLLLLQALLAVSQPSCIESRLQLLVTKGKVDTHLNKSARPHPHAHSTSVGRAGQGRAGQGRAGKGRAGQGRAGQTST